VNKKASQASFLNADSVSVLVLVRHCRDVKNARHSRGDQPRATDETIDDDLHGRETGIIVVSFTVSELVTRMIDNMPSDTIIQPNEDKGKTSGTGSENWNVSFSSEAEQVHKPRTLAKRLKIDEKNNGKEPRF
jgi:hypothetical protein